MKEEEEDDPFLLQHSSSDLKIAAEFLTNWLPFLNKNLCHTCTLTLSNRIFSLHPYFSGSQEKEIHCHSDPDTDSLGSWRDSANGCSNFVPLLHSDQQVQLKEVKGECDSDTNSLGSWKESVMGHSKYVPDISKLDLAQAMTVKEIEQNGNWGASAKGWSRPRQDVYKPKSDFSCQDQPMPMKKVEHDCDSDTNSLGSWKDSVLGCSQYIPDASVQEVSKLSTGVSDEAQLTPLKVIKCDCDSDTNSLGSWKDSAVECTQCVPVPEASVQDTSTVGSPSISLLWADMAENDFDEDDDIGEDLGEDNSKKILIGDLEVKLHRKSSGLSREERVKRRFNMVKRKKDFICLKNVYGTRVNILDGLELHTGVFSSAEQQRIVDFIYCLEEKGRKGELAEHTFSAPEKCMPSKGRVTIQFSCCYNYAVLKDGSPAGILRDKHVDPLPDLFKVMIRRLVEWHVIPPTCVPDSCIVNIYGEGDCIPPHIDHHDFLRPFCTVSFLSECNIVFGSTLKIMGPGDFSGDISILLPLGSVLILNRHGADVAKHCVPKVPTKRISITFRKMDESKHPIGFVLESDLQGLQPLPYKVDTSKVMDHPVLPPQVNRQSVMRENSERGKWFSSRGSRSEPRYSGRSSFYPNGQGILPTPRSSTKGYIHPPKTDFSSEKRRVSFDRSSRSEPRNTGMDWS